MTRALVLGAGRVGAAIARDLAAEPGWAVTVVDRSPSALASVVSRAPVQTTGADLSSPDELERLAAAHDVVVGALPSFLGFAALSAICASGKPYVDISFFAEDPFVLDGLACERGCVAVVDCGIAPGLDNIFLGWLLRRMERVESFTCYVGGLPVARTLPWEYKAPFAPYDVLAEYTRPARWVSRGEQRVSAPLTDLEELEVPGVGTLEAFLTDGLRTLLTTVDVPEMKEKTLRYPGHADKIQLLARSGFLDPRPIRVGNAEVTPLEVTSRLLFPLWELGEDETDLTVMRVVVEGTAGGRRQRHVLDVEDRRDAVSGLSSMARTTGFTCAAVARLVAAGDFREPGVKAPEHLGGVSGCYERIVADLSSRGISIDHRVEE